MINIIITTAKVNFDSYKIKQKHRTEGSILDRFGCLLGTILGLFLDLFLDLFWTSFWVHFGSRKVQFSGPAEYRLYHNEVQSCYYQLAQAGTWYRKRLFRIRNELFLAKYSFTSIRKSLVEVLKQGFQWFEVPPRIG